MTEAIDKSAKMEFLWTYITVIAPLIYGIAGLGIYGIAIFMTREKS